MRSDTNSSLALEVSGARKVCSQRTPPLRVRTTRSNETVHQINPLPPLSGDEVSYKLSLGLEVLRVGKVGSQRTLPPSSKNAKAEQPIS